MQYFALFVALPIGLLLVIDFMFRNYVMCKHTVYDPERQCCAECGLPEWDITFQSDRKVGTLPKHFAACDKYVRVKVIHTSEKDWQEYRFIDPLAPTEVHDAWEEMMVLRHGYVPKEPKSYDHFA